MGTATREQATQILGELAGGNRTAAERLFPLVYDEMRALADQFLRRERSGHTLQPTALVHEAYLRLIGGSPAEWRGESHFRAVAARVMRHILINHAEARRAAKRGGAQTHVTLSEARTPTPGEGMEVDLLALDEALKELEALDERQCRVVELRFFSGLSVQEAAQVLGVSERTVELDWKMARAWLYVRLGG